MGIDNVFDRLDKLILDGADMAKIRGLVITIRDQAEKMEAEKAKITEHASALQIAFEQLKATHRKEIAQMATANAELAEEKLAVELELAKLKTPNQPPSIEEINQSPRDPIKPLM